MDCIATDLFLHKKSRQLEVVFSSGERFSLAFEYLRVFSPSAEVRGHGLTRPKCVTGKETVDIVAIEPVGNYGIKPHFSDGHNTGIYSWDTLYQLGANYQENWADYLVRKQQS